MAMGSVTIRFGDYYENLLESLIKRGIFKTKSEAIRSGVRILAEKHGVIEYKKGFKVYKSGTTYL
jgi:Arc/MetJ-type ribon-helix-helix transcriptional regulator